MSEEKFKSESYELLGGINSKASPYVNGPMEFRDILNFNFLVPGALSKRPGSTLYLGATVTGRVTGGIEFERLSGASYLLVSANTNLYTVTNVWTPIRTGLLDNALTDFVPFVDRMFVSNGSEFFKTDGQSLASFWSLPAGLSTVGFGASRVLAPGLSGVFQFSYGYLNDRGYAGPAAFPGFSASLNGVTFGQLTLFGLTAPDGYGISAIIMYRTLPDGSDFFAYTTIPSFSTFFAFSLPQAFGPNSDPAPDFLYFTMAPKYLEIYNNQLFMAGFSSIPSTALWSEIGEPEGVLPDSSAEFRTNDGDVITGMRSYAGSLVVTKNRSFHRVTGDDSTNFALQELSDQYGCLSNRAMVVWENTLWFLDQKGICEYDGSNVMIVSNKMEPTFRAMNVQAARENAIGFHFREYNEVWFCIPTDGATFNNTIVVYDYLCKAWTRYQGLNASSLFLAKATLDRRTPFIGGYSGNLFYVGASFMGDSGAGITCMFDSYFLAARGKTTENMYRRFYLDVNPIIGSSQPIDVRFRTNYGSTIQLSRTMYQNPYQSRIDFGLSARSIQAEITHASATLPFQINGFSFESRLQRLV